jgi:hypothetical protein
MNTLEKKEIKKLIRLMRRAHEAFNMETYCDEFIEDLEKQMDTVDKLLQTPKDVAGGKS